MGTLRTGEKLASAGASPLRASIGEQITAKRDDEAKAEADRKAKLELGTAPTRAMSSSNPPPPAAIEIPKPTATPTLDAFKGELEAEKAAEAARLAREAAETGEMPASVDVSLTGLAPVATPPPAPTPAPIPDPSSSSVRAPNPVILGVPVTAPEPPREAQPTLSNFVMGGRFARAMREVSAESAQLLQKHRFRLMFFGPVTLVVIGLLVYQGLIQFEAMRRTDATEPGMPTAPPVTTVVVAPVPERVVEAVAPVIPDPPAAEPGLRGRRGERVTMRARDAYPVSCLTAWVVDHTDDAVYLCTPGQRRGNDMCDCYVTGVVP
ncbi:hypothetical protein IT087_03990 [Candidatus Uhrbacteria bacterium]|nr:hypothetical protein [Candidatus Uhrbacteria bacterium]